MISVIVTGGRDARDLHLLLSALVPAAAEGLVRQVLVLDEGLDETGRDLCEDAGADICARSLAEAAADARCEWLLVAPADLRLRRGWDQTVSEHLESGGEAALLVDRSQRTGWLARLRRPAVAGVLVRRKAVAAMGAGAAQAALVRKLGRGAARLS